MVGLIEILLPEFGNGGRHVHRSAGQAPRLNAALIRGPLRYINGANTYQFVGSSPVGLALVVMNSLKSSHTAEPCRSVSIPRRG